MSKGKKGRLAPGLRFPEFNNGNWNTEELGKVAELIEERTEDSEYTTLSVTSGVGLVSQMEKFGREISGSSYKNYYVIRKWDFAYNKSATKLYPEGYISMLEDLEDGAVPNSIFTCFRVNRSKIYPPFLNYLFHDNYHGRWLRKFIEVGARAHGSLSIDTDVLLKLPIVYPSPNEQKKISDCLSSLDELITVESQKLAALQQHKKGLMQQLFPAEGEKVPKLRFKEFGSDWSYKYGNEIFDSISDKNHNSDLPILAITQEHGAIPRDKINYTVIATETSIASYKVVEVGDFIISLRSFQGGIEYSEHKGICSPAYVILRKAIDLHDDFFKYYFKTECFIRDLNKNIEGIRDGKMVSYKQFSELLLPLPSIDEQVRIAKCLSSLDGVLNAQYRNVEFLKAHKKGLMQQLFPSSIDD